MPGTIQSIERAAAMLRLLGSAGRPLALAEIAAPLDLPRPTAHGILRTLREVGFVDQDRDTARYTLASALRRLGSEWDRHDLRSRAMNWADSLAGSSGQEVLLGMPAGAVAELVHHVFRPDGSPQRLRTGEQLPLHATAVGKCLLALAPIAVPRPHELDLQRYTGRTMVAVGTLTEHLVAVRHRGWAAELGEHRTGVGGIAAPLRTRGGLVVGALGVVGPAEELFNGGGTRTCGCARRCPTGCGFPRAPSGTATRDRTRGRGHRPGHHLHPLPAVQPLRPDARRSPARAPPVLPAAGLGRARRRGDLAQRHADGPGGAAQRRPGARGHRRLGIANQRETTVIWDRHTGTPLARAITWQDTRPQGVVAGLADYGRRTSDRAVRAPAGHLLRRAAAALAARPRPGRAGRRGGRRRAVRHDGELAGLVADRRSGRRTAHHGRHQRQPHDAHGPADARDWAPTAARRASTVPRADAARRSASNAEVYGTCTTRPAGCAGRRGAGRPARRARRSGVLRAGRGEVHVRHRRVPADEHRARGSSARPTA